MWNSFRITLNGRRKEHLADLACLIFKNSMSPLVPNEDPDQWMDSFAGKDLRWEALGILFTYWTFGAVSSSPESAIISQLKRKHERFTDPKKTDASFQELCVSLH
jgi:hypothetical protein